MKFLKITFLLLFTSNLFAQIPSYYDGINFTQTGTDLFNDLATKLSSTHSGVPYTSSATDTWDVLKISDEDSSNSNNILLVYGFNDTDSDNNNDRTRAKSYSGANATMDWNREHVFAKSLANPALETGSVGPGTDVHNLRPADAGYNSSRSNRKFTDGSGDSGSQSNGGWYPGDEWKGDIARIVMYMYVRYHGTGASTSQTSCLPTNVGIGTALDIDSNMIDLFLEWNEEDPVSAFESNRNNAIASYQENRNPFIDNPYLATLIWGGVAAQDLWNLSSGSSDDEAPTTPTKLVSSTITKNGVSLSWTASTDNTAVYDYKIFANNILITNTSSTNIILNTLEPSTSYEITVSARDAAGNESANSNSINITTLEGDSYLIQEDFENCDNLSFVFYDEASDKNWECSTAFGNNNSGSVSANGYQESENSKDWMITKNAIDFDAHSDEKLNFYLDARYGSSPLELVYSADYIGSGNPADATWTSMPNVTISTDAKSTSEDEVYNFENVDLSSLTGNLHIAFKYYTNGIAATRWTVDDFEIFVPADLSVNDFEKTSFIMYPNPATNFLNINSFKNIKQVIVSDLVGQVLKQTNYNKNIDISDLRKGMYLVTIVFEDTTKVSSTIVKK